MPRNYIKVFGERAVRLVEDRLRDNLGVSETRVIADTAMKLGTSREPLRRWVMRARVDAGVRPRVSTEESAELKRLRQENGANVHFFVFILVFLLVVLRNLGFG